MTRFSGFIAATLIAIQVLSGCSSSSSTARTDSSGVAPSSAVSSAPTTAQPSRTNTAASRDSGIPGRPEQLKYPPFDYDPPKAGEFRVPLKSGPVAYVASDRELPLVNIVIYARTGGYLTPQGKTGLPGLAGYLLARGGTKTRTAEELEERLAFLAAQLQSSVSDTEGTISLNLLSKDLDEGLAILREVLTAPRFQEDKLVLAKQQTLQAMKQRNDDSGDIQDREEGFLAYGEKFWANQHTTQASLEGITREGLLDFHTRWFHPSNFIVAVSGDFERGDMLKRLENLFSDWPFPAQKPPAIPTDTAFAKPGIYIVNKEVNQGRVSMMLPGIKRDNPDYFAVLLMNQVLGGGGFSSRIVNRVRSDEGLAYDARSSFPGGVYYPDVFSAGFQTKSRTVPFAASIILEEIGSMVTNVVTDAELNTAKRSYIDQFPRIFASKASTVNTFAREEFTGRYFTEPEFFDKYRARFEAITKEDVQRVARKYLLNENLVILVVGEKDQITLGHPDHPVKLTDLAKGAVTELPLRDPLTMEPIPPSSQAATGNVKQ